MRLTQLCQLACVIAIAVGTGLLVAGNSIDPFAWVDGGQVVVSMDRLTTDIRSYIEIASGLKGVGAACLAGGVLGLLVPWINLLIENRPWQRTSASSSTNGPAT